MAHDAPPAGYDIRQDDTGWTVFDVATGAPALVDGLPQVGLRMEAAIHVADLLATMAEGGID